MVYKTLQGPQTNPILVSSLLASMVMELGSVALQAPVVRCSTHHGSGLGGRDVQLKKLGNVLTEPTHKPKKCFTPSDELSLPDNVLAPVRKKPQKSKKVWFFSFVGLR